MSFDDIIDRVGTHCAKWDKMEELYGVSPQTGISMWVADMDFRPPACIAQAMQDVIDHGVFGYFGDDKAYKDAIAWWHRTRHGWEVQPDWIFTTHGLVNGTSMCIDTWTQPGDAVVLFTPVYHAFHRVIRMSGREIRQLPLARNGDRYEMDFSAYDALMQGNEKMVVLCSPHNPGGRVWSRSELEQLAEFARKHDLILVSDEIHQDLVYPGHKHTPMALIEGIEDRLVMMSATTKTFSIAGSHTGNVFVPDAKLREAFANRMMAMGISPNAFGMFMATAGYSPEGAAWVDDLMRYLEGNRVLFDAAMNAIPGVRSMPLEATYLAWVDFADTGMSQDEVLERVQKQAQIATNHGPTFGIGGDGFLRFNIATPRARVVEATDRMQEAFRDLQ